MEEYDLEWLEKHLGQEDFLIFIAKDRYDKEIMLQEKLKNVLTTDQNYTPLFTLLFKLRQSNSLVIPHVNTTYVEGVSKMKNTKTNLPQAEDIAKAMMSNKKLHVKAIHEALLLVRQELELVRAGLVAYALPLGEQQFPINVKHMGVVLARSTALLVGLLDALVVCAAKIPSKDHSFKGYSFEDLTVRQYQTDVLALRSGTLDFFALANYWKHYFPYNLLPSHDVALSATPDYYLEYCDQSGGVQRSGPLVDKLILPAFNNACNILMCLNEMYGGVETIVARL